MRDFFVLCRALLINWGDRDGIVSDLLYLKLYPMSIRVVFSGMWGCSSSSSKSYKEDELEELVLIIDSFMGIIWDDYGSRVVRASPRIIGRVWGIGRVGDSTDSITRVDSRSVKWYVNNRGTNSTNFDTISSLDWDSITGVWCLMPISIKNSLNFFFRSADSSLALFLSSSTLKERAWATSSSIGEIYPVIFLHLSYVAHSSLFFLKSL